MSLLFITDFLPPSFSATGQYTYHFAKRYSKKKIKTSLIGIGNLNKTTEEPFLKVHTFKAPVLKKNSSLNRLYWNLYTCIKICYLTYKIKNEFKYLVFNGAPQLLIYFIFILNLYLKKKIIYRTTDFFPETLIAFSKNILIKFILKKILLNITNLIRQKFYKVQYLGYDQKLFLEKNYLIKKSQIKRDLCLIKLNDKKKIEKKYKIIMYSGNLGLAHDYKTFVNGYKNFIRENPNNFKLWINATGQSLKPFLNILKKEKIKFFYTKTVPIEKLGYLLSKADIHLVFLKNEFSSIVLPSKIYCLIKSQKSIIYIGPKSSDLYYLVRKHKNVSFQIDVNDEDRVKDILKRLS